MKMFISLLLVFGSFFVFLAGLGLLRFPDLFTRSHATTKAATLGKIFPYFAIALAFMSVSVALKTAFIVVFFFVTAPVASHLITRAGYKRGAKKHAILHEDDYSDA